jgi:hypothetical protein
VLQPVQTSARRVRIVWAGFSAVLQVRVALNYQPAAAVDVVAGKAELLRQMLIVRRKWSP